LPADANAPPVDPEPNEQSIGRPDITEITENIITKLMPDTKYAGLVDK